MNKSKVFEYMGWVTIRDVEHKLILYVSQVIDEYTVDKGRIDPDGVPLVYFKTRIVTRIRKMTEEEYTECVKRLNEL